MKKRTSLFLLALALTTTALVSTTAAARPLCGVGLACFIGPVCCSDAQCDSFCQNLSPGSVPHCSGTYPDGGCCSCDTLGVEQ